MFLGEYEHTIDDKSRLTLPARFRAALAAGVVVTRGIDDCLDVYPADAWERLVETRLATLDPFTPEARKVTRLFFGAAVRAEPDRQGRVPVPVGLRERVKIDREVVVVGVNDHLEIWDRRAWGDHLAAVEGSANDVAERLAQQRG